MLRFGIWLTMKSSFEHTNLEQIDRAGQRLATFGYGHRRVTGFEDTIGS